MNVQAIPRALVTSYLSLARLPVAALARATGQQDNQQWPPTLLFERIEAAVETRAGRLLRDDRLVELGTVRRTKVGQLEKATALQARAESVREQAGEEFTERREKVERARQDSAIREKRREQQIERDAQKKQAQVRAKAAKTAALARDAKAAHDDAIDRRERAATSEALTKEAEALRTREQALQAARAAEAIDDAIRTSKATRRTG